MSGEPSRGSRKQLENILTDASISRGNRIRRAALIEMKMLVKLAAPAVVGYMINYLMSMSTQVFSGHLGNLEYAAASLGNTGIQVFAYGCLEIQHEKQGSRSHTEYLSALEKKRNELQSYRPITTDLATLQKRAEEDDIFQYLAGLNPSYEAVKSQIMTTVPLPSYSQIKSLIQQEESRRIAMNGQIVSHDGHETHGLAVKNSNFNQNPSFQNRPNQSKNEKCNHCKKDGHTQDRCWHLYPHLRPKKWKGNDQNRNFEKNGEKNRSFVASVEEKGCNGLVGSSGNGFGSNNTSQTTNGSNYHPGGPNKETPNGPSIPGAGGSSWNGSGAGGSSWNGSEAMFGANGSFSSGSRPGDQMQHYFQQFCAMMNNQNKLGDIS